MQRFDKRKKIKELDKLWSIKIRERDGKCLKCGNTSSLQAAHILSRKNLNIRFDLENGLTLCIRCHLYWAHKEPIEFTKWVEYHLGKKKVDELYKKSQEIKHGGFSREELEKIEEELKNYEKSKKEYKK